MVIINAWTGQNVLGQLINEFVFEYPLASSIGLDLFS